MTISKDLDHVGHRRCTLILSSHLSTDPRMPRYIREATHCCWCSAWRRTRVGWRVWRNGRWLTPNKREVQRVSKERWELLCGDAARGKGQP
jgi:hypothetical protein